MSDPINRLRMKSRRAARELGISSLELAKKPGIHNPPPGQSKLQTHPFFIFLLDCLVKYDYYLTKQSKIGAKMVRGKPLSFDRDDVLAKAMELFWKKGYQNTGMSELLDHMGIQRQSFYNTFGSKENIFLEAVTLYTRNITTEVAAVLNRPGNPMENVRQVLNLLQDEIAGAEANGCMLGNSIAEFGLKHPQISALLKKNIDRMMEAFTRAFTQAIEQGLLPATKDPSAMAMSLIAMIQGTALLSKLGYADGMLSGVMKTAEELITA